MMTRREALHIGLAGGTLAFLSPSCQERSNTPEPPEPPVTEPVYELMPGSSLYDDFDGHGNFQTYDDRDLAVAGALYSKIWVHDSGSRVIDAAPPGLPLLLRVAGDPAGSAPSPSPVPNHVVEISCIDVITELIWMGSPREISFADFGSLGADVMLSSRSTAPHTSASLNFHTTIPEQPPGRSWYVALGIFKSSEEPGGAFVLGQYLNLNLGIIQNDYLGPAVLDEWRSLRLDIVTKAGDPGLGDQDIRLDYYLDGTLRASRIPEDTAILIDPSRTGLGPHRSLVVNRDGYTGEAVGCFDNVRAVYRNRIA
jgi:hypothetical protein